MELPTWIAAAAIAWGLGNQTLKIVLDHQARLKEIEDRKEE